MPEQNLDNQISFSKRNKLPNINRETTVNHTINELHIESLKRKINMIIQYQKPNISKSFSELLVNNFENAKIIYLIIKYTSNLGIKKDF